jgi:hypothetical protein
MQTSPLSQQTAFTEHSFDNFSRLRCKKRKTLIFSTQILFLKTDKIFLCNTKVHIVARSEELQRRFSERRRTSVEESWKEKSN